MKKLVSILLLIALVLSISFVFAKDVSIPEDALSRVDGQESGEEVVSQNRGSGSVTTEVTYYYTGAKLLATEDADNGRRYYHQDRLGTNRVMTDSSGNQVDTFKSLPYGQVLDSSDQRFSFSGKEYDESSGLYDFGAREYDPDTGRFISVDPVEDELAYAYVRNNPMNLVDPTGMSPIEILPDDFIGPPAEGQMFLSDYIEYMNYEMKVASAQAAILSFNPRFSQSLSFSRGDYDNLHFFLENEKYGSFVTDTGVKTISGGLSTHLQNFMDSAYTLSYYFGMSRSDWKGYEGGIEVDYDQSSMQGSVDVSRPIGPVQVGVGVSGSDGMRNRGPIDNNVGGIDLSEPAMQLGSVSDVGTTLSVSASDQLKLLLGRDTRQLVSASLEAGIGRSNRPEGRDNYETFKASVGTSRIMPGDGMKVSAAYLLSANSMRKPHHLLSLGIDQKLWGNAMFNVNAQIPLSGIDGQQGIPFSTGLKFGF